MIQLQNINIVRCIFGATLKELQIATLSSTTVLDTENFHFFEEFLDFPVQMDVDIHADMLGFSAHFCCDFPHDSVQKKSKQEFRVDLCRQWRNPAGTYVRSYLQRLYVHSQHTSFISGI